MNKLRILVIFVYIVNLRVLGIFDDSISFKGLLYSNFILMPQHNIPFFVQLRYIPQMDYNIFFKGINFDIEASLNVTGNYQLRKIDTFKSFWNLSPYRLWGRLYGKNFEIRIGLQEINFGSATILRPLQWFDQIDPADPLRFTGGVYGLLVRYYFKNNSNLWLWCLSYNDEIRGYDPGITSNNTSEFGGRIQWPIYNGEIALTYHHRYISKFSFPEISYDFNKIPENRFGIDMKVDIGVGL